MSKTKSKIDIHGIENGKRKSTQELLQEIYKSVNNGYTEFNIEASGQHDIGGPLWSKEGNNLKFNVKNPGQRVGCMGMQGTQIVVEGPAPADVGWLNAGAEITVKGDGGDTTAHCAASGKIYIGGRVGTRSGALMKHDPKFPAPEFWTLRNTGSFSFEFMGGGTAIVCGWECENLESVLGTRSCVGMVGGTVYVRGKIKNVSDEVFLLELDDNDKDFLSNGLLTFLKKIDKVEIYDKLTNFDEWKKIVAKTIAERDVKSFMPMKQFREKNWVQGGIFGDLIEDDYYVSEFVEKDNLRLRYPEWRNALYSAPCEYNCPTYIPTQKRIALLREGKTAEALNLVLDYSPFPASVCGQVCPNLCINDCNRKFVDIPVKTAELGILSKDIKVEPPKTELNKKIAVIGAGASGLTAAWHLRRMGYSVDVFEQDKIIGGKLKQVIPQDRLNREILDLELKRIEEIGVNFKTNTKIDKNLFKKLEQDYEAVVVAVGAHVPAIIPFEGHERLIKGLDFLKAINNGGEKPKIGEKVVVIGAGNAAMDVVLETYKLGAKEVTAIDIQKPSAFDKEIKHVEKLGAKIIWPCFTEKISEKGVHTKDGTVIEADTIIIAIGDRADVSFLDAEYLDEKGLPNVNEYFQAKNNSKIFFPGDVLHAGLFTDAIGNGRKVAINIAKMLSGQELDRFEKSPMIPQDRIKQEFYNPIHPQNVMAMGAEAEQDRCMSCGVCRDCEFCKEICPEMAISRIENSDGTFEYVSDPTKCIGCGICAGVCPCGIWTMQSNLDKSNEV